MSRRKAEMYLELVDRATKPLRKVMRLQERMGRLVDRIQRGNSRSARLAQRAAQAYSRAVQGLSRAQDALQRGIRRSNENIRRQVAAMRTATGRMRSGFLGVGRAAVLAGGFITAYSGAATGAGISMLGPSRQFEKFQTVLETTEGSAIAAQRAMGWVQNFAVSTPYELDQVMAAFVQLRAYGLDPTNGLLMTLGDTAAAMNKDVIQAVEAMADAVMGENERLKEFGIKASKQGKFFEYTYNMDGRQKRVRALADNAAQIEQVLTSVFHEKYGGAMERLSATFDGMQSNVMDQWRKFQLMIMENGVFDWFKDKLAQTLATIDQMAENGQLALWAERIADNMLIGLNAMWAFGAGVVDLWQTVTPHIQATAEAVGGWRNLALLLLAIPLRGTILGLASGFMQLASGLTLAARAAAGIGFGSLANGVLSAGRALLWILNPVNLVRVGFIALHVALVASGIGVILAGLAMAGVWIWNNWSGLGAFFTAFGASFIAALGPAGPLAEHLIGVVQRLWGWIARLVKPLDVSARQWAAWGRAAGRFLGNTLAAVADFVDRVAAWFGSIAPINWGAVIPVIKWGALAGGVFVLSRLVRPLRWTAKLIGFIPWLTLTGGKFALKALVTPLVWSAKLISRIPWATLTGGKFAVKGLVTALKWTSRLIPGIGWAVLAGELGWHLLIKKIDWSQFEWLKFDWSNILPKFAWRDLIPEFNLAERLHWRSPGPNAEKRGARVQKRARGGSFGPGWLLTGEAGPELEYRSERGFIAHNRALQNMVAMSETARRNNSAARSGWAKGTALAAFAATPAAADPSGDPSSYLSARSGDTVSVNAPITISIQGNVDQDTLPDLKRVLKEFEEELMRKLEEKARAATRRAH